MLPPNAHADHHTGCSLTSDKAAVRGLAPLCAVTVVRVELSEIRGFTVSRQRQQLSAAPTNTQTVGVTHVYPTPRTESTPPAAHSNESRLYRCAKLTDNLEHVSRFTHTRCFWYTVRAAVSCEQQQPCSKMHTKVCVRERDHSVLCETHSSHKHLHQCPVAPWPLSRPVAVPGSHRMPCAQCPALSLRARAPATRMASKRSSARRLPRRRRPTRAVPGGPKTRRSTTSGRAVERKP